MPNTAIFIGLLLIAQGATFYLISPQRSPTALIPAVMGVLLLVCGLIALKREYLKHAMHAAAVVALLGVLGSASGVVKGAQYLSGSLVGTPETGVRPIAYLAQSIALVLCLTFLVLAVRSFIAAKKLRQAAAM